MSRHQNSRRDGHAPAHGITAARRTTAARAGRLVAASLAAAMLSACAGGSGGSGAAASSDAVEAVKPTTDVPVRVDTVRSRTLNLTVTAPGRTRALRQDRVRAPFPSRLVALRVTDGDRVSAGEVVAEVVSKNSEAAVQGAEQMLATATTAQDSADARRAIAVARAGLVRRPLHAPAAGVVLSHAAETGDYLSENEVLLTIAEAGAVYFEAQVTQGDLDRVRPGQHASIDMPAAGTAPVSAIVHDVLPSASSQNLSAPVRLDFSPPRPDLPVGLFGTTRIVVGRHADAIVVPASAVLRDDVSGVSRVAVIDSSGTAHWVVVQTGIREGGRVQIVSPHIAPGTLVITDGQVGLPDGAKVQVQP